MQCVDISDAWSKLSRNNACIAIACEERDGGSSVFRVLRRGKPSGARALAAYGPHLGVFPKAAGRIRQTVV
jgi:hypothetical protein